MKKSKKRIILVFLGVLIIIILSLALTFYFSLMGNPFVMWQQKQEVLNIYNNRYTEGFRVIDSHYDYKRGEYFYTLEPIKNPDFKFSTSVFESTHHDVYAELRAESFIRHKVEHALDDYFDPRTTSLNVHEQYGTQGNTESDVLTRLRQKEYVLSVSIDVDQLDPEAIDDTTFELGHTIDNLMDSPIGSLKLRVMAYDGTNYHFSEADIR